MKNPSNPITQVEVEESILYLCDELESECERYAEVSQERAIAETEYKERFWVSIVKLMDSPTYKTASQREAAANLWSKGEWRKYKLLEAQEKATQQKLMMLRSRLEAVRTIAANVRAVGG